MKTIKLTSLSICLQRKVSPNNHFVTLLVSLSQRYLFMYTSWYWEGWFFFLIAKVAMLCSMVCCESAGQAGKKENTGRVNILEEGVCSAFFV